MEGVDPDLRVRPFFHHGGEFFIRDFAVDPIKNEMGLETPDQDLCRAKDPNNPVKITNPAGLVLDPALDKIKRPPVCSAVDDGDGDGVINEIDTALVNHKVSQPIANPDDGS
ncbi:MAG: hypothetical protein PHD43_16230 [Methylococcales bacterium]|nr:hypothetical protein [Methylococcales bacterium]